MANEKLEKDEAFWKVLSAAMELDVKKGHLKWTLSDLSRKSGITRSLIYYYFGRSKQNILNEAVKMIGERFAGLSDERIALWEKGELAKSMCETRAIYDRAPFLGPFFLEHRGRPTEVGEALAEVEKNFRRKLEQFFPGMNKDQIGAIFVVYWGMSFAPECSEKTIGYITDLLKQFTG